MDLSPTCGTVASCRLQFVIQFQRTNRVIAPTPSSHPPTSTIPEKRRSIDEGRVTISLPEQQTLPQSSLVRHSLSDIDMEQAILGSCDFFCGIEVFCF